MLQLQNYSNLNTKSNSLMFVLWKAVSVVCKVVQRMALRQRAVWDIPSHNWEFTSAIQIRLILPGTMSWWKLKSIEKYVIATSEVSSHMLQAISKFRLDPSSWLCLQTGLIWNQPGPLFAKPVAVLPPNLVKPWSRVIGCYNDRITLTFDRYLGSVVVEVPAKFQRKV